MIRTMLKFWLEVFIPLKTRYAELIYNSYRTERFITRLLLLPYILSNFGCNLQKRWNFFFFIKSACRIFSLINMAIPQLFVTTITLIIICCGVRSMSSCIQYLFSSTLDVWSDLFSDRIYIRTIHQ
jgi:hypothetical protein